jgi:pilus assembly protein CpaE
MNIVICSTKDWQKPEHFIDEKLNHVTHLNGILSALFADLRNLKPELLILAGFKESKEFLGELEIICRELPDSMVVPISSDLNPKYLMLLMQIGVREVLASEDPQEIAALLGRVRQRRPVKSVNTARDHRALCLAFMSAKGGDGGTCIATNFAAALADQQDAKVMLLDLSMPFGDAEIYLGAEKSLNDLSDFANEVSRLDHDLLNHMVAKIKPNFHMIASPPTYEKILSIEPDNVEKLIDLILTEYRYVVIDIGTSIDNVSLRVLDKLQSMIIVSTLTMPSLRRTSQIMELWESLNLDAAKVSVVVNRYVPGHTDIELEHFEKALGKKVTRVLPADSKGVQQSLLQGVSLHDLNPKSKLILKIKEWANTVSGNIQSKKTIWHLFGKK